MTEVLLAPFAHGHDDGGDAFAERREAIFSLGRHDRVEFAVNQAVLFHFSQLHGEHFGRGLGELALQLTEAQHAGIIQVPNDESFVFAGNDSLCCL